MKGTNGNGALVQIRGGDVVRFVHPETGKTIEGTVSGRTRAGGIKVQALTGVKRSEIPPSEPGGLPGRSYVMEETTWTVPSHIAVTVLRTRDR
jgi:hypothetical protein